MGLQIVGVGHFLLSGAPGNLLGSSALAENHPTGGALFSIVAYPAKR